MRSYMFFYVKAEQGHANEAQRGIVCWLSHPLAISTRQFLSFPQRYPQHSSLVFRANRILMVENDFICCFF